MSLSQLTAATAKNMLDKSHQLSQLSTCNKRQVGAVVELSSGRIFGGSSGGKGEQRCNAKGPGYCTRDDRIDLLEYLTCPSLCAEGDAMIAATGAKKLADFQEGMLAGARIYASGFPCQRCRGLMLYFHVGEVIFEEFKTGSAREHESIFIEQMLQSGIRIKQLKRVEDGTKLEDITTGGASAARLTKMIEPPLPGEYWLTLMFDQNFRNREYQKLTWFQKNFSPVFDKPGQYHSVL